MEAPADATLSPPVSRGQPVQISWVHPSGLLGLALTNGLLRILTLGIYNFWGKTEVRKRIWSAVRLDGEPLAYTGTGKELFLGFLIVFGVVLLPIMLVGVGALFTLGPKSPILPVVNILIYVLLFFLTGVAIYRAQRYRLSRTRWRGIHGGLTGSDMSYAWTYFWSALLIPVTMGWIMPWRTTQLQTLITRDTRFGDRPFRFNAEPGPLYGPFTVLWVGAAVIALATIPAIGGAIWGLIGFEAFAEGRAEPQQFSSEEMVKLLAIIYGIMALAFLLYYLLSAWYRARQINHFAAHTHFEGATLKSTVTGGGLIRVAIGNFLLTMTGWAIGLALFGAVLYMAGPPEGGEPQGLADRLKLLAGVVLLAAAAGLFSPFVQARNARYLVQNLSLVGPVDLAAVAQGADQGLRTGEGLAQAFDVDAF